MQQHLLLTKELKPIPDTIKTVRCYPNVMIVQENDNGTLNQIWGDNVILEGEQQDFIDWLKPFDGIWIGNGVPQLEQFEIMHIK